MTVSLGSARPVGLLGEHRNVISGWVRARSVRASSGSMRKSSVRPPSTRVVPVSRLMCECSA